VKLWTRSHKSHLGLRWFLAHNFTPAHEPPARHPLSKPADRFLHVDTLRENRMFFTRDYHVKKKHINTEMKILFSLCFVRVFTSEILLSDDYVFRSLMARSYQVRAARALQPPGGGSGTSTTSVPGTATATTCTSSTCTTSGGGNYCTRSLTLDTTTGIFTGSITTNQCPNHAGAYQFNGVKDNLVGAATASCITFTVPVSGYSGPKAAPLLNGFGYTISGGEVLYGPMDAGFTVGQVTTK